MYDLSSMSLIKAKKERIPQYDLMRVVAMFLVVYIHSNYMFAFSPASDSKQAGLYWFTGVLALVCNALFFMVSGKFNLAQAVDLKPGEYRAFYIKKAIDLLIPIGFYIIVFWILRFVAIGVFGSWTDGTSFWDLGAFLGTFQELLMTSWWFIPMIFSLMIFTPFIGRMLKGLQRKEMYLLLAILFGCAAVVIVERLIGQTTVLSKFLAPTFGMWMGIYMLGYVIDKVNVSSKVLTRWCIAAVSLVVILGLIFITIPGFCVSPEGVLLPVADTLLLVLFYPVLASALFLLFKSIKITKDRIKRLIEFVGNRAFGIYLIHFCFLFSYVQLMPDWFKGADDAVSGILKRLIITVLVYLASLGVAIVVDLFVVNPVQKKLKSLLLKKTR